MLSSRDEFWRGFRQVIPVMIAVIPFGLIVGITAEKVDFGPVLGISSSAIIFAGASQLATMALFADGAAIVVVVATALIINARFVMYSASLLPHLQHLSRPKRLALSYLMTDQAYALSVVDFPVEPPHEVRPNRHWFYIGVAVPLFFLWMITTAIGYAAGASVPDSWSLEFAVVLVFLALIFPTVTDRPTVVAALAAGVTALVASPLPFQLGLPVAAVVGIAAGVTAERRKA